MPAPNQGCRSQQGRQAFLLNGTEFKGRAGSDKITRFRDVGPSRRHPLRPAIIEKWSANFSQKEYLAHDMRWSLRQMPKLKMAKHGRRPPLDPSCRPY